MSYPTIFPPGDTPVFLAAGHGLQEEAIYATVERGSGHSRARRVYTRACRIVDVSWILTPDQMEAVDEWFEDTLKAGELHFTAWVANQGPGQLYWDAVWLDPYTADPFATKNGIFWRVTGRLLLSGDGTAVRPLTGDIALEVTLPLEGAATVVGSGDAALEVSLPLLSDTGAAALEVTLPLEVTVPTGDELRELATVADGYELRELATVADGREIRG